MSTVETPQEFYRIQKLPPYVFAVINEMKAKARAAGQDVVDLGMGNPDGATPRVVVNKMVEATRNPRNHRYSMSRGIPRLRDEIVKRYKDKYDVDLDPESEAIVTIGAKDALAHLLFAIIGPGDVVVSPNPAYPIHQYGVIMAEGHACTLPMPDPASFLNSLGRLCTGAPRKPKIILISFPHNPTTQCVEIDFFRELVPMAAKHGTMIVHDFAYADLGFDGYKPPSLLQVEGAKEIGVEIFSISKSFNMAGWRVGFCVGNQAADRRSGADQELSGLRDFSADPDCVDHRAARVPGRDRAHPHDLSASARRADSGARPRGLARGAAARNDVRVGAGAGAVARGRIAGVRKGAPGEGAGGGVAGHRLRPAGRGLRALRAGGERSPDEAGDGIDQEVHAGSIEGPERPALTGIISQVRANNPFACIVVVH